MPAESTAAFPVGSCVSCGATPAAEGKFTAVRSFVIAFRWQNLEGTWCRSCALERFRDAQYVCLTRGWWGLLLGPLTNSYAVISNYVRWRKFRTLGGPHAAMVETKPSRPLRRRPAAYTVLALLFVVFLIAGLATPQETGTPSASANTKAAGPIHDRFKPLTPFMAAAPPGWKIDGKDVALTVSMLSKGFKQRSVVEAHLSTAGFLRGLDRQYYQEAPRKVVGLELWHFASAEGAKSFYQAYVSSNEASAKNSDYKSSFSTPAGGWAFIGNGKDTYGFFYGVGLRLVGDIVVHVRYASLSTVSRTDLRGVLEWTTAGLTQTAVA
jgi:hypothetical protein